MSAPIGPLFTRSLKGWLSAKGFWVVVAATLLPLVITGAWVGTHRADVAVTGVDISPQTFVEGTNLTFTEHIKNLGKVDVGQFNATLIVGTLSVVDPSRGAQPVAYAQNATTIDHLAPGETKDVVLSWNATAGSLFVIAQADTDQTLLEVEKNNNFNVTPLAISFASPDASGAPPKPTNVTGGASANSTTNADLAITDLALPTSGDNRTVVATVTNHGPDAVTGANVTLQVGQNASGFGFYFPDTTTVPVDLAAGASTTVNLTFAPASSGGVYWAQAFVNATTTNATDPNGANNEASKSTVINPPPIVQSTQTEAQVTAQKQTIKEFYLQLIILLHLTVLVPLVALFYAGGIIGEERDRKTLGYILTKPTPRWAFPLVKFVASFVVAGIAIIVGLVLTYLLLFSALPTGASNGYLMTPILVSLLALLVYGAFFAFLGVAVDKPYLWGLAIVLGWENAAFLFLPWVRNFTFKQHVVGALADADYTNGVAIKAFNWPIDQGLHWIPTTPAGIREFWIVLAIAAASLIAAAYTMKQKEFEL